MSISYIPEKTKIILWGQAAGRCEYEGCNKELYADPLTKSKFNQAYIAHIVADKPDGPRGDKTLSPKLKNTLSNLMLLCDTHHRLVDIEDEAGHPVSRLDKMKKLHEARIRKVTGISKNKEAHIILYGANIGMHNSALSLEEIAPAIEGQFYPSNDFGIQLSLGNSLILDHEDDYWKFEKLNLLRQYKEKVLPILQEPKTSNIVVFALAPQPLLMQLGTLLHDLKNVEVFNPQKEPKTWKWQRKTNQGNFLYECSEYIYDNIALVFALSAQITNERIYDALGLKEVSIYKVTLQNPNPDFLQTKERLAEFRVLLRSVFDDIKTKHGERGRINIFPAMQPAAAVEVGRVWYPKADLPLDIYDQNRNGNGFIKAIEID